MSTSITIKGLAATAASAALLIGAADAAGAQQLVTVVPGDHGDGRVVIVNDPGMEVEITDVDRVAGSVAFTMTNNLGHDVFCEAPSQDAAARPGGTISTAEVAEKSAEYYSRFQNVRAESVSIQSGSLQVALWPLQQFIPMGSVGAMMSDAVALRAEIAEANMRAKTQGLYGTGQTFRLNNGQSTDRTIALQVPATSPRGEGPVGLFIMCGEGINSAAVQGNAQLFAWSAYEEGYLAEETTTQGSLESGSLGSVMDGSGSAGSTGDADVTTGSFGSSTDVGGKSDDPAGSSGSAGSAGSDNGS